MTKSTDNAQSKQDKHSSSSSAASGCASAANLDEQHFWRALKKDEPIQTPNKSSSNNEPAKTEPESKSVKPIELTADLDDLSAEDRENRRKTLRSMLSASEARQQGAIRARRPTPEAGLRVGVRNGPFKGNTGIILDADYIQSRVLLDMEDGQDAQWIAFARLHSLVSD
jgi:hypothetical protein